MREDELLQRIYATSADLPETFARVIAGPGHDCAVVDVAADAAHAHAAPILLKTDQLIEGRHYRRGTPIDLVARKAIARAVSDIAASGGRPIAALAAATLPADFEHAAALFDAMHAWARQFGCPLVGGDIATLSPAQAGPVVLTLSIVGLPHPMRGPVLRSGARVGDAVYVTGSLGGSFDAASGLGRHLTFDPCLAESAWLCDTLGTGLHAMMDLSDGLGRDAARLAAQSGVRLALDASTLPIHGGAAGWQAAMSDGEDYELLFCADRTIEVPGACPGTGRRITRVGTVEAGAGATVRTPEGATVDASAMGWEHR